MRSHHPDWDLTTPPYIGGHAGEQLNESISQWAPTNAQPAEPTIKSVAVVGALFDKDHNIYDRDHRIVLNSLRMLREAQISMAKNIEFQFYNLLAPIKSDFMAAALVDETAPKADVVISCYIYGTQHRNITVDMLAPAQKEEAYSDFTDAYSDGFGRFQVNREIAVSHLQRDPEMWPRAAAVTDAKFVITYGGKYDELFTDDFLHGKFYQAAIHTGERGIPTSSNYGLLVNNAHLPAIQAEIDPDNFIGNRIRRLQAPEQLPKVRTLTAELSL